MCCVLALQKPRGQNRWVAGANNSIVRVPVRTSCGRGGSYRMRRGAAALARGAPFYNLNSRLRLGSSSLKLLGLVHCIQVGALEPAQAA
mgnify:CR=1 FL=1